MQIGTICGLLIVFFVPTSCFKGISLLLFCQWRLTNWQCHWEKNFSRILCNTLKTQTINHWIFNKHFTFRTFVNTNVQFLSTSTRGSLLFLGRQQNYCLLLSHLFLPVSPSLLLLISSMYSSLSPRVFPSLPPSHRYVMLLLLIFFYTCSCLLTALSAHSCTNSGAQPESIMPAELIRRHEMPCLILEICTAHRHSVLCWLGSTDLW